MHLKRKTIYSLLAALFLCAGSVSCTVKENRVECPVWIMVTPEVDIPDGLGGTLSLFAYRDGVMRVYKEYDLQEFSAGIDFSFQRGPVEIAGVVGWPKEYFVDDMLTIPFGGDCPPAWGFDDSLFIESDIESVLLNETLRSLFANMTIRIKGAGEDYPYGLVVEGDVDGYLLASLRPHHGPFLCVPGQLAAGDYEFRFCQVPRQDDGSLTVSLVEEAPVFGTKAGGDELERVYTLPLGEILAEQGYDWSAEVPEDIDVLIDFSSSSILITVCDWTRVVIMNGKYVI